MSYRKECMGYNTHGQKCTNEAITDFCFYCDPNRQSERLAFDHSGISPVSIRHYGRNPINRDWRDVPTPLVTRRKHKNKQLPLEWETTDQDYLGYGSDFAYGFKTEKYKPYKPPVTTLKKGQRQLIDKIAHMEYYVMRAKSGRYHAVYLSRLGYIPDNLVKQQSKLLIWDAKIGKPHYSFWAAENEFYKGESLFRIRQRIKNAADPEWLPPNLRALAASGKWNLIPQDMLKKLKEWVAQGCCGWYGKKLIHSRTQAYD